MGGLLLQELELPAGARRVLTGSRQPLLARHVGTKKSGQPEVLYPDFLVVDEATLQKGSTPHVESISVKKRDFSRHNKKEVEQKVTIDVEEATNKYGGQLEVRRPGHPLYGRIVQVSRVHLVYESKGVGNWQGVIQRFCDEKGVGVHFK